MQVEVQEVENKQMDLYLVHHLQVELVEVDQVELQVVIVLVLTGQQTPEVVEVVVLVHLEAHQVMVHQVVQVLL
jgi:hypothetical protein